MNIQCVMPTDCSVDGCKKPSRTLGLCVAHYTRLRRNGDPLGGRQWPAGHIEFLDEAAAYQGPDCLIWPYTMNNYGYGRVSIDGVEYLAHRVVCERVHGPAPTKHHEVAHDNNGKPCVSRACVNPAHLRWATRLENRADCIMHGTQVRGARAWKAKLTEDDVREIRRLCITMTHREVADRFGVRENTISRIWTGARWGWLV